MGDASRWSCAPMLGDAGAACTISYDLGTEYSIAELRLGTFCDLAPRFFVHRFVWPVTVNAIGAMIQKLLLLDRTACFAKMCHYSGYPDPRI